VTYAVASSVARRDVHPAQAFLDFHIDEFIGRMLGVACADGDCGYAQAGGM
jgi:hypothetical protein